MIRINLLPHREWKRKAQRQQLAIMGGITALIGLVIVGAGWSLLDAKIAYQNRRNLYLEEQAAVLDKQIAEIQKLKEDIASLLARKQVVETLQTNRAEVVHLLSDLAKQLPEGLYLKTVKQQGTKVTLSGYAESNARVSSLMTNLSKTQWIVNPTLVEIKAVTVQNKRINEFNLNVFIKRPEPEPSGGKKGPAKPPAAPAAPAKGKAA